MIGVGVIGYGYWGPNLVRNFNEVPGSRVVAVSDMRSERLAQLQHRYPAIKTTTDHRELLTDSSIDAIAVATPVSTHFDLAMQALDCVQPAPNATYAKTRPLLERRITRLRVKTDAAYQGAPGTSSAR